MRGKLGCGLRIPVAGLGEGRQKVGDRETGARGKQGWGLRIEMGVWGLAWGFREWAKGRLKDEGGGKEQGGEEGRGSRAPSPHRSCPSCSHPLRSAAPRTMHDRHPHPRNLTHPLPASSYLPRYAHHHARTHIGVRTRASAPPAVLLSNHPRMTPMPRLDHILPPSPCSFIRSAWPPLVCSHPFPFPLPCPPLPLPDWQLCRFRPVRAPLPSLTLGRWSARPSSSTHPPTTLTRCLTPQRGPARPCGPHPGSTSIRSPWCRSTHPRPRRPPPAQGI